ncbi:MAG TPA: DNA repair protein RecN [Bacteroidales bacterium]|nr:DNA repair protein RecN [Bacteroidales bacterium]HOR03970.1 DNA repair protein RecN [Bacteroidales bacterium]HOU34079.1 DNA repair protein RecN [Bacteroidales bacterium]HPL33374.1 DNA repair protein RecN [Bacteroidales bacterium]HQI63285.1 DNA repair protein RecN [Bacteroidales bacterium]
MLCRLSVKNYALIEELEFEPGPGFNIITGETGAGKSILLGALGLILGNRADMQALRDNSQKCIVEGTFKVNLEPVNRFLHENNLDVCDELIMRREILPGGKSRAFVNDTPVNLNALKIIGDMLVDIHSQHENLLVNEAQFQLAVLDDFARNKEILSSYYAQYLDYRNKTTKLELLSEQEAKSMAEQDFIHFQLDELHEAHIEPGEQAKIENELSLLTHAEEIKTRLSEMIQILDDEDSGVIPALASQFSNLNSLIRFDEALKEIESRYTSCFYELKDILQELIKYADTIHYTPDRIAALSQRLDILFRLQQKHRVKDADELIEVKEHFIEKLNSYASLNEQIESLQQEIIWIEGELEEKANRLSDRRKAAIQPIQHQLKESLSELGMPDASIEVVLESTTDFIETGKNRVNFLFSANVGQEPRSISKVASGGEISRLMLAIKSLISNKTMIPVLIFDEIDAGVSGGIAAKAGRLMKQMARNMQIIAITHIPQIAALGDNHFLVSKKINKGTTQSIIERLSTEGRIRELAGMLSNHEITQEAIAAAKQLLK